MASEDAAAVISLYRRKASEWIKRQARTGSFEKP